MIDAIKALREKTSAGMMDCQKALQECGGDLQKAIDYLRKKGLDIAAKKSSRTTKEGRIESYIHHGGKIGVLLEVNCETDFVAKNEDFKKMVKEITMQIAAAIPRYVRREDVPAVVLDKEKEIVQAQLKNENKPAHVLEKIVEGKLAKFYEEVCLMEQPYIKDPNMKVKDLMTALIAKIGENILIRRFVRYQVGEEV